MLPYVQRIGKCVELFTATNQGLDIIFYKSRIGKCVEPFTATNQGLDFFL